MEAPGAVRAPIDIPPFTTEERDWRWARVRAGMAEAGLDLLIVLPESDPTDAFYVAQEMGAMLFPAEGEPWILLGGEDSNLAVERDGWIAQRESATQGGSSRVPYGQVVAAKIEHLGLRPRRVGIAGLEGNRYAHVRSADGYVIHRTVVDILHALAGAEVVDGAPVMAAARHVKSEAEIDIWRASVAVAERAAQAIGDAFVVGAPQAEAFGAGLQAFAEPGVGISHFAIAWCPGQWGQRRPRLITAPPGRIEPGLCVSAEISPAIRGYGAHVAEPYLAGPITAEQREAFAVNIAAFDAVCRALRPGTTWREVKAAATAVGDGTDWTVSFLLHSRVDGPLFIPVETNEDLLDHEVQANATFVCKPTVYPSDQENVVARSHDVTWGDSIVVREGGAERLGTRPQLLHPYGG